MTILLLAGTGEARAIAAALAGQGMPVVASLAGAVRQPLPLNVPTRIGGFGGEAGFLAYLDAARISAVIDATHPFATRITPRTARICAARRLPYLRIERPGWQAGPQDHWTLIDAEYDAAAHIPDGQTVFLATGRQTLGLYAGLAGSTLYCRQIDPAEMPFPYPKGGFIIGRPPFSVQAETDLFQRLGITWLIAKDAGGVENRTKLDAARDLGIKVLLIRRPATAGPKVETVQAALDWAARL